ncbi:hypothetical protein BJX99DRAFT_125791 [Aspergillus californicus]
MTSIRAASRGSTQLPTVSGINFEFQAAVELINHLAPCAITVLDKIKIKQAKADWHQVYTQVKRRWTRLRRSRNR